MTKFNSVALVALLSSVILAVAFVAHQQPSIVKGQALENDPPNPNASAIVQTTIDPADEVFTALPNRTVSLDTSSTNDIDFKGKPPVGITVIVGNDTVTITKDPVTVPSVGAGAAPATSAAEPPADEGASGSSSSDGDSEE